MTTPHRQRDLSSIDPEQWYVLRTRQQTVWSWIAIQHAINEANEQREEGDPLWTFQTLFVDPFPDMFKYGSVIGGMWWRDMALFCKLNASAAAGVLQDGYTYQSWYMYHDEEEYLGVVEPPFVEVAMPLFNIWPQLDNTFVFSNAKGTNQFDKFRYDTSKILDIGVKVADYGDATGYNQLADFVAFNFDALEMPSDDSQMLTKYGFCQTEDGKLAAQYLIPIGKLLYNKYPDYNWEIDWKNAPTEKPLTANAFYQLRRMASVGVGGTKTMPYGRIEDSSIIGQFTVSDVVGMTYCENYGLPLSSLEAYRLPSGFTNRWWYCPGAQKYGPVTFEGYMVNIGTELFGVMPHNTVVYICAQDPGTLICSAIDPEPIDDWKTRMGWTE